MSRLVRRAATLLAVATCALPAGSAQAAPTENVARAINEQDGTEVFDFAWQVTKQRGDDAVEHRNSATARARCTGCEATAVAFQIVLVSGSPDTVVPINTAEALNLECTACEAVAEARQFVRVFPQRVRLTREGRSTLSSVRRTLAATEWSDPPASELHRIVEAEEARVKTVLADELVLKSHPDRHAHATATRTLQDVEPE